MEPIVHTIFEPETSTWQYVVTDLSTKTAVILDPTADSLLALVGEKGYIVDRLLETHVHANHLTAATYLQDLLTRDGKKLDRLLDDDEPTFFCGDSIFNCDVGSARCDFPGGNAKDLFQTASKLFSLPPNFKIYTGHDYPPNTPRSTPQAFSTVAEQMEHNKHLRTGTSEADFVRWRTERDAALAEPRLIHQALQVNIRAGRLPRDGLLHMPVNVEGW
ncbi:hypothetical protein MYCTH_104582 [Thermothelomyces thermophilus ATCC 42464]|uniref:Metallo-beta-lactamase domain-containing protein n=1 Tax=Thermothelomyces thermophilus (strain ATCC 42464 / BCRC 31852 / DSM 1799) TaxID=573729 RepID=G2QKU7_THET4|nr:uncharacterized protein MYCTH_104582 [Thermothelomyces thermophilus ATCC 42464]AEO60579.1 hypothetical protein MYCTH_104582 [Thermothelomyces thermophilus ATCC 42464]